MQVLLRKTVERLGEIGDIVDVKTGYARNHLLPHGLAAPVNDENIRRVQIEKKNAAAASRLHEQEIDVLAEKLASASITLSAKANEEGHLFGSITVERIADALKNEGYNVEEKMIYLSDPIKELGVTEVPIQLKPDLTSSCKVWVIPE